MERSSAFWKSLHISNRRKNISRSSGFDLIKGGPHESAIRRFFHEEQNLKDVDFNL